MKYALIFPYFFLVITASPPFQINVNRDIHFRRPQNAASRHVLKAPLPLNNVLPSHYEVQLTPLMDGDANGLTRNSIPGNVKIIVAPVVNTNIITLNALDVNVNETTLMVSPVNRSDTTRFNVTGRNEVENEFYILTVEPEIEAGKEYEILIDFTSFIATDKLNGIYLTGYVDPQTNELSKVVTTQFEASAARQAFPCFDEPWAKATFKIILGYDSSKYIALSNSNVTEAEIQHPDMPADSDWKLKEFADTVEMSTYLVAILIGNYTSKDATPQGLYDKPVKVYGPPHLMASPLNGGDYGATKSAELLIHFEDYFEIDYKMQKMDSVVVPDFWFGAMENWGLNFYRESLLMYYEDISTEAERETITSILAHELVHQWFGNLVTAEFWDQIWLNEGFATYFAPIATEAVAPEFEIVQMRQFDIVRRAMEFDASPATHPLINSAHGSHSYDELMDVFDRITYEKGGALIRMMEAVLTPKTMQAGLIDYLHQWSFGSVDQDDLFLNLTIRGHAENTLPKDRTVKDFMDTWSHQTGFPLVRVSKSSNSRIIVSQERFVRNVQYSPDSQLDPNDLWEIPVTIATAANPDFDDLYPDFWIEKDVAAKILDGYDTTQWILVNADGVGYYRVLYDVSLFNLLVNQLDKDGSVISTLSKSQLLDDYFTLAEQKFTVIENALRLTKYLGQETKHGAWITALFHLERYYNKLSGTKAAPAFEAYLSPKIGIALSRIGWDQESNEKGTTVNLRAQLLDWACAMRLQPCLNYATQLFSRWDSSAYSNRIPADLRPVVYCGAVSNGDEGTFTTVLNRYKDIRTSERDKSQFLSALACTAQPEHPIELLNDLLEETSDIAHDDKITFLRYLGASSVTRADTTAFVVSSTSDIIDVLGDVAISEYVRTLSTYVGTSDELSQIDDMIDSHAAELKQVLPTIESSLGIIRANIAWRKENEERLEKWFTENRST